MSRPESIVDEVRRWIDSIVVGLDLCPFARRVVQGNRIRYVVSEATDSESLRTALAVELRFLAAAPLDEVETTILTIPMPWGSSSTIATSCPSPTGSSDRSDWKG